MKISEQLKRRAGKHAMTIRKVERGEDSYMLVDIATNAVVVPEPMTLEKVSRWLDDLDNQEPNSRTE